MKQKTFIIGAIIVVVILLAAFAYLLIFGTPKNPDDIFNDLGLAGEEEGGAIVAPPVVEEPVVNMNRPRLRQLTTKPVIGFTEVAATAAKPIAVQYVEAGTGHIYTIDLTSGKEERISNTTIAEASVASFSPNGDWVAIKAKNDRRATNLTIGTLASSTTNLQTTLIEKAISDFKIINNTELVYTVASPTGLQNIALDLTTGVEKNLFTVPFFEASFQWGTSSDSSHYVYNRPSYTLEGYLYRFTAGKMGRVPVDGFGLTVFDTPEHIGYIEVTDFKPKGYIYNKVTDSRGESPVLMLPEKCTYSKFSIDLAWCAYEMTTLPLEFPDYWYKGTTSFKDTIWEINLTTLQATPLVNTLTETSGREIDIMNMSIGDSESGLYFINKNDNTLWMYEL